VSLGRFPEKLVSLTDLAAVVQVSTELPHFISKLRKMNSIFKQKSPII
jgi:hypothetical protein